MPCGVCRVAMRVAVVAPKLGAARRCGSGAPDRSRAVASRRPAPDVTPQREKNRRRKNGKGKRKTAGAGAGTRGQGDELATELRDLSGSVLAADLLLAGPIRRDEAAFLLADVRAQLDPVMAHLPQRTSLEPDVQVENPFRAGLARGGVGAATLSPCLLAEASRTESLPRARACSHT